VFKRVKEIRVLWDLLYFLRWMNFIPLGMVWLWISYILNPFTGNTYMVTCLESKKSRKM
jgi:hypothetical protein